MTALRCLSFHPHHSIISHTTPHEGTTNAFASKRTNGKSERAWRIGKASSVVVWRAANVRAPWSARGNHT